MNIVGSGIAQAAGTVTIPYGSYRLFVDATADAVVTVNGFNIAIPAAHTTYLEIPGQIAQFIIVSGTINWFAVGQ